VLFRPTTSPTGRRVAQANKSTATFNVSVPGKEIGVQKRFSMTVCDYVIVGNELYITVPSAVIAGRRQALSVAGE
jgi:endonuclease/exonuclease/phosphatase family metal-dependent hydrolase